MGESYCNDGSCALTRRGEKHPAHVGASVNTEELSTDESLDNSVMGTSYCNDGNCELTRRGERHPAHLSGYRDYCEIQYIGGHKAYPSSTNTKMYIYNDHIEIENPPLTIPYSEMTNIENADKEKISLLRVVMFGVIGVLWKKNHIFTVIQYRDEMDDHTIVVDFDEYIDEAQPLIYRKMLEWRKK